MKKPTSLLIFILFFLTNCTFISNKNTLKKTDQEVLSLFPLDNYNQNIFNWINPSDSNYNTSLLTTDMQQRHLKLFYDYTYGELSPWDKNYVDLIINSPPPEDIVTTIKNECITYSNKDKTTDKINYGENFRPLSLVWIEQITDDININQFCNLNYDVNNRAIAISNLHARTLPTNDVSFYNHKIAGEGYPFDNLQMSSIWAGTPLYVLGTTRDKSWSLVITSNFITWVESNGIVKTSNSFVAKWKRAAKLKLGAIISTKTNIIDSKKRFLFSAYIGSVFPIINETSTTKKLMIAVAENNQAVIKYSIVSSKKVKTIPLNPTLHNIANLISNLIGRPYGWGGVYFYNDCSAELKNFFTPFGIWLPRNAEKQASFIAQNFQAVDISNISPKQRLSYLMQNGKPFFTIIYIGGHVFLYIGNYPNSYNKERSLMAMTYQNIWGLSHSNGNSRSVIGGSVFLPLLLEYPEVPCFQSLVAKKYFHILYLDRFNTR